MANFPPKNGTINLALFGDELVLKRVCSFLAASFQTVVPLDDEILS